MLVCQGGWAWSSHRGWNEKDSELVDSGPTEEGVWSCHGACYVTGHTDMLNETPWDEISPDRIVEK